MRRFRYRLERLLELRRYREREWELKLAGITGRCLRIRSEIQSRHSIKGQTHQDWRIPAGPVDINRLFASERYLLRMDQEIKVLGQELVIREEERTEIQGRYLEVSKMRKVLDKLKERRQQEYYQEQKKEELKSADETYLGRASRRKLTGG